MLVTLRESSTTNAATAEISCVVVARAALGSPEHAKAEITRRILPQSMPAAPPLPREISVTGLGHAGLAKRPGTEVIS